MPHISNRKISEGDYKKIYNQLISIFDTAGKKLKSDALITEFLTETERIMLSKRLAILFMLDENISKHYISEILLVSSSTVDRISLKYELGKFPFIRSVIKNNKKSIWQVLEKVIRHSVQKQTGRRRLAWLDKIDRKYERKVFKI